MGFQAWWGLLAIVMATAPGFSLHSGLFFYAVAAAGLAVLHCYCWINESNAETSNQPAGIESVVALFLFVLVLFTYGAAFMFYFPAYAAWTGIHGSEAITLATPFARCLGAALIGAAFWHFTLTLGDYSPATAAVLSLDAVFLLGCLASLVAYLPIHPDNTGGPLAGVTMVAMYQIGLHSALVVVMLSAAWLSSAASTKKDHRSTKSTAKKNS